MHQLELIEPQMQEILANLEEEEFNFEEDVAVFYFRYPSKPEFQFQLAIGKLDEEEMVELGSAREGLH